MLRMDNNEMYRRRLAVVRSGELRSPHQRRDAVGTRKGGDRRSPVRRRNE